MFSVFCSAYNLGIVVAPQRSMKDSTKKNINTAGAAMATQSNKLGKCITPIHLDRLLFAKMDHIILPLQCG